MIKFVEDCSFNVEDIVEIDSVLISELKRRALVSPTRRFRFCMHHSIEDQTHEMVIAFHKNSYMPPHRHPRGKSESYHIIEGSMEVYFFNEEGSVCRTAKMGVPGGMNTFLYRLSSDLWHMPVPVSEWLVYHETYSGPFNKEIDVEFASWAPKDLENRQQIESFLSTLNFIV